MNKINSGIIMAVIYCVILVFLMFWNMEFFIIAIMIGLVLLIPWALFMAEYEVITDKPETKEGEK